MDLDTPSTDTWYTGTIDCILYNFSNLQTEDCLFSETILIRDLFWKLILKKYNTENELNLPNYSLGVFLQCNNESENLSWSCFARATLSLFSQRNGVEDFSRKISGVFHEEDKDWGFSQFISWNEVMNPEFGYIKDDTVILRAEIIAGPPTSSNSAIENILVEDVTTDESSDEAEIFAGPPPSIRPTVVSNSAIENILVEDVSTDESSDEMDCDELCNCKDGELKIQSLEEELSQTKKDLEIAKSDTKSLSEILNMKSAELHTFQNTITTLESKVDTLEEMLKSKFSRETEDLPTTRSAGMALKSKVDIKEENIGAELEEMDPKCDFSNEPMEEKHVVVDVNITINGVTLKSTHSKRYAF